MDGLVSIVRCSDYRYPSVRNAVKQALSLLNAFKGVVHRGDRVLIKPNLLSASSPERAITTHPTVVRAVVEEVRALGGIPWIGDSPGGIDRGVERVWNETEMRLVAAETGAQLISFEASGVQKATLRGKTYHIAKPAFEAQVIVNLPKLKTHSLTLYTGAIKNLFGLIPGFRKAEYHKQAPLPFDFSQILVDIFCLARPHLNIMDAIVGMEGDGPSAGQPKRVGFLLASLDAIALDVVATTLMGLPPRKVDVIDIAFQRGLGARDLDDIRVVGEPLNRIDGFKLTSNRKLQLIPKFVAQLVGQLIWVRPRAMLDRCTRCQLCRKICPAGAITFDGRLPRFDDRKCIMCLCCHELCPEGAIKLKMSWLARRWN